MSIYVNIVQQISPGTMRWPAHAWHAPLHHPGSQREVLSAKTLGALH